MTIRFIILCILLLGLSNVFSQNNETLYLNENRYTIEQGLPDNWVKDMAIDSDGFLWLGTVNGISKFDSYNFVNFSKNSDFNLVNHNITSITVNGDEIIASTDSGIEIINYRNYKRKFIKIDANKGYINKLLCTKKGDIFVYQSLGFLSKFVNGKFNKCINIPKQWFRYMLFDDQENIVLAFNSGTINIIDNANLFLLEQFKFRIYQSEVFNVFTMINQTIGIMANSSCFQWSGRTRKLVTYNSNFEKDPIVSHLSSKFIYYTIDNNTKLIKQDLITNEKFSYHFNTKNRRISKILTDKNNNILISSNQGLFILNPILIKPELIQDNPTLKSDVKVRRALIKENDSNIFMLNYEYIEKYNPKTNSCETIKTNKLSIVGYCGIIMKNKLWIGLDGGGVGCYDLKSQTYNFYSENKDSVVFLRINHIDSYFNNQIILSTDNGLQIFDTDKKSVLKVIDSKSAYTFSIRLNRSYYLLSSNNHIFIANNHLNIIDTFNLEHIENGKSTMPIISQILIDRENPSFIWAATDVGLFKIDIISKKKLKPILFSKEHGGNKITHILYDQFNRIWASSYNGIYCYHPKHGSTLSFKISSFPNTFNQMLSDEYNYKCGLFFNNKRIIFGGLTHYLVINPEIVYHEKKSDNLFFSKINVSGETVEPFNTQSNHLKVKIKTESNQLSIKFGINNFKNTNEFQYFYKINKDGNWINIGNKPFLNLFNLDDGRHTIYINAKNSNGIFSKNMLSIEYYLPQVFYRTIGFYIVCLLIIILIILIYVRQRSIYLKELIHVKQQISYDMHDELGSILTGTSMLADLVQKSYPEEKNIQIISRNLRTAIRSMKDMIWSVDNSAISIFNLIDRLSELINQTMENKTIELKFNYIIENKELSLNALQKRNFLSTTKEILNNVLKHSEATLCQLDFTQKGKEIIYKITDNGKGFSTELNYQGIGLKSIRERIKSINGNIEIKSNDKGTQIKILVKL